MWARSRIVPLHFAAGCHKRLTKRVSLFVCVFWVVPWCVIFVFHQMLTVYCVWHWIANLCTSDLNFLMLVRCEIFYITCAIKQMPSAHSLTVRAGDKRRVLMCCLVTSVCMVVKWYIDGCRICRVHWWWWGVSHQLSSLITCTKSSKHQLLRE